jgi:hypothetical protein
LPTYSNSITSRAFEYQALYFATKKVVIFTAGYESSFFGSTKIVAMNGGRYVGGSAKQASGATDAVNERVVFTRIAYDSKVGGYAVDWAYMLTATSVTYHYTVDYMVSRHDQ